MTLIDSIYINNSGGKVLLDYLVSELEKSSNEVYYLFDDRCKDDYNFIPNERKIFVKSSFVNRYKFYYQNKYKFNKVLCFANFPPPLNLPNAIVMTYFHNLLILEPPKGLSRMMRLYLQVQYSIIKYLKNNTNYWIVQSRNMKNVLAGRLHVGDTLIKLIPFFKMDSAITSDIIKEKNTFLYVSSGAYHKNHLTLLKAWKCLSDQNLFPKLTLTLTVPNMEIRNLIDEINSKGGQVLNIGFVPKNSLTKIYLQSEYLIYPSLSESFGLPLIEGVNYGCKIIGADLPYTHSVVMPSKIFNPLDAQLICETVKSCLESEVGFSEFIVLNELPVLIELLS